MRTRILAAAAAAVLPMTGCGTTPDVSVVDRPAPAVSEARQATSPWSVHRVQGWEVESYDSLDGLVGGADLVAVGTVTDVGPGPRWVESEGGETMVSEISAYTVELTEVLSGRPVGAVPGEITVEFGPDEPSTAARRRSLVGESALFVLRRKGAAIPAIGRLDPVPTEFDREVYRVVNSTGLIDDADGVALLPLGDPHQPWAEDLASASYAEALALVRAAAATS